MIPPNHLLRDTDMTLRFYKDPDHVENPGIVTAYRIRNARVFFNEV